MTDTPGTRIARKLQDSAIGQELNLSPAEETVLAQWIDAELAAEREAVDALLESAEQLVLQGHNLPHQGPCEGPFAFSLEHTKECAARLRKLRG